MDWPFRVIPDITDRHKHLFSRMQGRITLRERRAGRPVRASMLAL